MPAPRPIAGLSLVASAVHTDPRGTFREVWHGARQRDVPGWGPFVQENESWSRKGVLRGLHAQVRPPQGKLVRVLAGEIYDVAVDLRPGSPTWGRWEAHRLSAACGRALWIPPGLAHGYLVVSDEAVVTYHVTAPWDPEGERALRWDDPEVGIAWPLDGPPLLSARDAAAPGLRSFAEMGP